MTIDLNDIKHMIKESVNRTLFLEAINKNNFIYVVFPVSLIGSDANRTKDSGNEASARDLIKRKFGIKPVPPFVMEKIPQKVGRQSYLCSIFTDANVDDFFKARYGDNNIGSMEKCEQLVHLLESFVTGKNENRHRAVNGQDFFVITVPMRENSRDEDFDYGEDSGKPMIDKDCLLISRNLMTTDSMYSFTKILASCVSSLSSTRQVRSGTNVDAWLKNVVNTTLLRNQTLKAGNLLTHVETAQVNGLYRGDTDMTGGNGKSLGIYWELGPFEVIQFFDNDRELYRMILNKYNSLGLTKLDKETGEPIELDPSSHRTVKGMDTVYGLYSVYAGVGNYGEFGQSPEIDVDFAYFDDVRDLMSWYRQFGKDMYSRIEKDVENMPKELLRNRYGLTHRIMGKSLPKGTVEKRDASLEALRVKFSPAVDEVYNPNTPIGSLANDIANTIKSFVGNTNAPIPFNQLMYPGKLYSKAALSNNYGQRLDQIAKNFQDRRDEFRSVVPNKKQFEKGIELGNLKKVIGAKVNSDLRAMYPEKGLEEAPQQLAESVGTIDLNDIKHMIKESAKRVLNEWLYYDNNDYDDYNGPLYVSTQFDPFEAIDEYACNVVHDDSLWEYCTDKFEHDFKSVYNIFACYKHGEMTITDDDGLYKDLEVLGDEKMINYIKEYLNRYLDEKCDWEEEEYDDDELDESSLYGVIEGSVRKTINEVSSETLRSAYNKAEQQGRMKQGANLYNKNVRKPTNL